MRKQLSISLAFAGLLTTSALAGGAGFMGDQAAAAGIYDQSQIQYIDGVAVVPVGNDSANSQSYYDWKQNFDWQACGVKDYRYQPVENCGGYYSRQCDIRRYFRACRFPCQQECIPHPAMVCNQTEIPVTPVYNVTNETVPIIPVPSGNITPPTPIVITNCSYFKVCRERPRCNVDQSWWDYWGADYERDQQGQQCGCQQQVCAQPCQQRKQRRRICNATLDESFDASTFKANNTYYDGCDCVVFQNCTNTTIIPPPIIPVPPIPSGGEACNYTCEDIRALHIVIANLSEQVQNQQNELDMLIGQFQNYSSQAQGGAVAPSGGAGGSDCCAQVASINSDIADLYKVVNNITVDASEVTLQRIRTDGVRFGDNWWMGEQGAYLFAIDITQSSYYRFDSGVNKTV